ncbi:MAG: DUF2058 family protein [Pseudomonadota bacterium]
MSGSLADQFLSAGLVSEEDVAKAEAEKKRPKRQGRGKPPAGKGKKPARGGRGKAPATPSAPPEVANREAQRARRSGEHISRAEREKRAQQARSEERRLLNIRLAELLKDQPVETPGTDPDGKVKFHYPYEGKIRGIHVTPEQRDRLANGEWSVTLIKAKTRLVPTALVESILAIDPERFIYTVDPEADDDAYADHPVPDDLMW